MEGEVEAGLLLMDLWKIDMVGVRGIDVLVLSWYLG